MMTWEPRGDESEKLELIKYMNSVAECLLCDCADKKFGIILPGR